MASNERDFENRNRFDLDDDFLPSMMMHRSTNSPGYIRPMMKSSLLNWLKIIQMAGQRRRETLKTPLFRAQEK